MGMRNPCRSACMVLGLGGTVVKAKSIASYLYVGAADFIVWGQSLSTGMRFVACVALMASRLCISTLVPPTSPAFGIIMQAATPAAEKWTAMPFFLLSSTVAGAAPYVLDRIAQVFTRQHFSFTMTAKTFTEMWPLTCWTAPAMNAVFTAAGGGKLGASLAVVVAHAAPFMGAQTTLMQRFYLPNPWDTILSQPFGMSEDLLSMALAEAASNPQLASVSLTLLFVLFNFLQYWVFGTAGDQRKALCSVFTCAACGMVNACCIERGSEKATFLLVALQFFVQLFLAPLVSGSIFHAQKGAASEEP